MLILLTISNIVFGSELPFLVTRGPYLQLTTDSSIVIRWRTSIPTNSGVYLGATPGPLKQSTVNTALTSEHEVHVPNLLADMKYYYAIGTETSILVGGDENHFFVTSPVPGWARPLRIWAVGDAGTGSLSQEAVRDAYFNYTESRHTDLILALGDNAYPLGTDVSFQEKLFDMYSAILRKTAYWPAIGNHDTLGLNNPPPDMPYFQSFTLPTEGEAGGVPSQTEAYYSFDFANVHFICLDTQISDRSANGEMAQWLIRDLKAANQDWSIAYAHYPPYTKGSHNSDRENELIEVRANLVPILEEGGVDLMLAGHSHSYERSYLLDGHYGLSGTLIPSMKLDPGDGREDGSGVYRKASRTSAPHEGTVYVVAGSAGGRSGGDFNHPAMVRSQSELGSLIVDVAGNRLDARFINVNGAVFDYFTIIKGQLRIGSPRLADGKNLSFSIEGDPEEVYQIEVSSDLEQWSVLQTITNTLGTTQFRETISPTNHQRFFRVRQK